VEMSNKGTFVWMPRYTDIFNNNSSHIIHGALDRSGNPVQIRMNNIEIESDFKFHTIIFSTIHQIKHYPEIFTYPLIGNKQIDISDNYWYRNYFQSISFTKSDLDILINLHPETKGFVHLSEIEIRSISKDKIERLTERDKKFTSYLWYLDSRVNSKGMDDLKSLLIVLRFENNAERNCEYDFLQEDRINYISSICKMHLNPFMDCCALLNRK
jgi:hypothetical protein